MADADEPAPEVTPDGQAGEAEVESTAAADAKAAAAAPDASATEPPAEPAPEVIRLDIAADVRLAVENKYERRQPTPMAAAVMREPGPFSVADESDFRASQKLLTNPPPGQQKTQLLVISLLAFVAAALLGGSSRSFIDLGLLVGVILFHELGHMAGMIVFGYRDVRIFFIPFLGGAASGRKRGVAKWKEALALLMGPLPGIIAGCLLAKLAPADAPAWVHTLTLQLILVNALNLLPVAPLDGGQLFSVLLFSRHRSLEVIFTGVTGALLGLVGVLGGIWVFAVIAYFVIASLPYKKRILDTGHRFRDVKLPQDPGALSEPQQRIVWRAMWDSLPDRTRLRWRGKPYLQARAMEEIVERATMRPPSAELTIGILVIWLAGLGVAVFGMLPEAKPTAWQVYTNDVPHFSIEFPGKPNKVSRGPSTELFSDNGRFEVLFGTLGTDEATWLEKVIKPDPRAEALSSEPHQRYLHIRDGYVRAVVDRGTGYLIFSRGSDADARHFTDSFHILE